MEHGVAMEEGRGPKRGPCANEGCKDPQTSGGQWSWLPPATELAGFDIRARVLFAHATGRANTIVRRWTVSQSLSTPASLSDGQVTRGPRTTVGGGPVHPQAGIATMLFLAAALALSTHLASAALPPGAHIDVESIAALSAGQDVCGDDTHGSACLRVVACANVDRRLDCNAVDDPIFTPDLTKTGNNMAFRDVLPLPASPHPNHGTLKATTRGRVVASNAYLALPRAAAVYETAVYEKQKAHPEACEERYCKIPDALHALHPVEVAFPDSKKPVRPSP